MSDFDLSKQHFCGLRVIERTTRSSIQHVLTQKMLSLNIVLSLIHIHHPLHQPIPLYEPVIKAVFNNRTKEPCVTRISSGLRDH